MPKDKSASERSILSHLPSFRGQPYEINQPSSSRGAGRLLNQPGSPNENGQPATGRVRRNLGGRGREWAGESLKLLEAMLELDDSKPFREPVDPLKWPEYYSAIANPIDLSKVMLKFHGGSYSSLSDFARDMGQMFDNHKSFFKDPNSVVYTQVHRLWWWFDAELNRIIEKWGSVEPRTSWKSKRGRNIANSSREEAAAVARLSEIAENRAAILQRPPEAHSRHDSTENYTHVGMPSKRGLSTMVGVPASEASGLPTSSLARASSVPALPLMTMPNAAARIPYRIGPQLPLGRDRTTSTTTSVKPSSEGAPIFTSAASHSRAQSPAPRARPSGAYSPHAALAKPDPRRSGHRDLPQPTAMEVGGADSLLSAAAAACSPTRGSYVSSADLVLELDVSNIWFGAARSKPQRPVVLTAQGLHLAVKHKAIEVPFLIQREEIVRCVAHFGRSRKHTLFVFVLPSCAKRLESHGERYSSCSLVVIFLNALTTEGISKMLHIFWNMSQHNIFGQLFSEVDQKAALALLANIKPGIMSRVADKFKGVLGGSDAGVGTGATARAGAGAGARPLAQTTPPHPQASSSPRQQQAKRNSDGENGGSTPSAGDHGNGSEPGATNTDGVQDLSTKRRRVGDDHGTSNSLIITNQDCASKGNAAGDGAGDGAGEGAGEGAGGGAGEGTDERPASRREELDLDASRREAHISRSMANLLASGLEPELIQRLHTSLQQGLRDSYARSLSNRTSSSESAAAPPQEDTLSGEPDRDDVHQITEEESDIEIVMPSDEEDEVSFVGRRKSQSEDADDVSVTSAKISIRCPITQQVMKNPMKNAFCSHCYDRDGVQGLIRNRAEKARCPVPGCSNDIPLNMKDMVYEFDLWQHIRSRLKPEKNSDSGAEDLAKPDPPT